MTEVQLKAKIKEFIAENQRNIVEDITKLVSFKSILGEAQEGAPFGIENKRALDEAVKISQRLGLFATSCEGYIGYAEVKGESEEYIASIAHLDVVPEGNGWKADPFTVRETEGWLIGRGVCDDKGPAVLTLYLLKFFKDNYPTLPYTLRAILGSEEETGMRDVDYYLKNYPAPVFTFSPDANFPVCCGEKGIASFDLKSGKISGGNVLEFTAGVASNVIPDRAFMKIKSDKNLPKAEGIEISVEKGVAEIRAFGIGGHAAMPEGTKNAIGMLVAYCLENELLTQAEKEYFLLLQDLFATNYGEGLGISASDEVFTTPLTCIGGTMKIEEGKFVQNINIRYPTTITGGKIQEILSHRMEKIGGSLVTMTNKEPFYVDKNSAPIQALLKAYNDATGKNEQPYTIGGGTYARRFPSAAAFGIEPCMSEKDFFPSFIGSVHGAEEGYSIDGFMKALEILILAVDKLMQVKF
ncbi:MAG: Sapep family Mn(2+)-dependent dipeptidase [Oscillospiraceae bacterium]